jgi:hypothetical protein
MVESDPFRHRGGGGVGGWRRKRHIARKNRIYVPERGGTGTRASKDRDIIACDSDGSGIERCTTAMITQLADRDERTRGKVRKEMTLACGERE